jgi:hypothetical protein
MFEEGNANCFIRIRFISSSQVIGGYYRRNKLIFLLNPLFTIHLMTLSVSQIIQYRISSKAGAEVA